MDVARHMKEADISNVSVSVDGPREVHDRLRGFCGSFDQAMGALTNLNAVGIMIGANTQVNRENLEALDATYDELRKHPLYGWQVQLMVPMGRAADDPTLWLEPYECSFSFPFWRNCVGAPMWTKFPYGLATTSATSGHSKMFYAVSESTRRHGPGFTKVQT